MLTEALATPCPPPQRAWPLGPPDRVCAYVEAGAADTTSLVSTLLLGGHSLQVEVEEGGGSVIEPKATG